LLVVEYVTFRTTGLPPGRVIVRTITFRPAARPSGSEDAGSIVYVTLVRLGCRMVIELPASYVVTVP